MKKTWQEKLEDQEVHKVIHKGKRFLVQDFQKYLV